MLYIKLLQERKKREKNENTKKQKTVITDNLCWWQKYAHKTKLQPIKTQNAQVDSNKNWQIQVFWSECRKNIKGRDPCGFCTSQVRGRPVALGRVLIEACLRFHQVEGNVTGPTYLKPNIVWSLDTFSDCGGMRGLPNTGFLILNLEESNPTS